MTPVMGRHSAQGGRSFGWNSPPPAKGDEARFVGKTDTNAKATYDADTSVGPNTHPLGKGKDSYTGIPGDGVVPG